MALGFTLIATSTTHRSFRHEYSALSEGGLGPDSDAEKTGFEALNRVNSTASNANEDLTVGLDVVIDTEMRFAAQLLSGSAGDTLKANMDRHLVDLITRQKDVETGIRQAITKAVIAFMRHMEDNPPRRGRLSIVVRR